LKKSDFQKTRTSTAAELIAKRSHAQNTHKNMQKMPEWAKSALYGRALPPKPKQAARKPAALTLKSIRMRNGG